jgi:predicted acetyltransferase
MLKLVPPDLRYKESYLRAERDFQAEGLPWHMDNDHESWEQNFQAHVDQLLNEPYQRTAVLVPSTTLWADVNGEFAGRISIRHELTDALRKMGGHIGYDTAPSFRGRGVASQMLHLALPIAKKLGLSEVLLTCDDTNIASIKVIEKNGGVLEEIKFYEEGKPLKRYYWIDLQGK